MDTRKSEGREIPALGLRNRPTKTTVDNLSQDAPNVNGPPVSSSIEEALGHLCVPEQVVELRILSTAKGTVSGFFIDLKKLAAIAQQWSGKCSAVYITLNPVVPSLLARASNRTIDRATTTTSDNDIVQRRWILFDFDPVRPSGISSTDDEHQAALARARECLLWLVSLGVTAYILADSGNGAHILLRIDLPNTKASTELVKRCLAAVALQFTDERVAVDLGVYNAARICKLYGTLSCKGDNTPDRPHRLSRILEVSESREPAKLSLLENLAALVPEEQKPESRSHKNGDSPLNLQDWIGAHNLDVIGPHAWNAGQKWIFPVCPFDSEHSNRAAVLLQFASGAVAFRCLHNSCTGNDWHALRDLLEPEWRDKRLHITKQPHSECDTEVSRTSAWPVLAEEALYGLAGEIVKTIDPYTEADPVAVLLNVLTAFGNCLNGGPHARVQHDDHPARLFVVQVGDTSKGRKGTGWSTPRYLFAQCDKDWAKDRVKSGLSSGEGLIYNVRDPIYSRVPIKEKGRFTGDYEEVCTDQGESDKRLLIVEPEFASTLTVMGREGNTLSAILRQAWDTGGLSPLTKNNPLKATGSHISIIGHITKQELLARLDDTSKANGFANRFLWALVKRSKELPEGGAVPDELLTPLVEHLIEVVAFARTVTEIRRDAEASALWAEVYHDLSEGKPGMLGAVLSRAEAQVLRLSVIFTLLDKSTVTRVEHLRAALAVWEFCERSAVLVFGARLGDPTADRILDAIRNAGPVGMTDNRIYELFGRNKSANERTRAVNLLLSLGLIEKAEDKSTGGRPSTHYTVK